MPEPSRVIQPLRRQEHGNLTAVRLALLGNIRMHATRAVLLADVLPREAGEALKPEAISTRTGFRFLRTGTADRSAKVFLSGCRKSYGRMSSARSCASTSCQGRWAAMSCAGSRPWRCGSRRPGR